MLQAQASTGVEPAALRTPPCPASMRWLLGCWRELASSRQGGFGVPQPISWADIAHWHGLMQVPLNTWELQLLRRIDLCWMDVWSRCRGDAPKNSKSASGARARSDA